MFRRITLYAALAILLSIPRAAGNDERDKQSVLDWLNQVAVQLA